MYRLPTGRVRVILTLLVLAIFAIAARANVREAKDRIVDTKTRRALTAHSDQLGFRDIGLPKGCAVAWISTNGCNVRIGVAGPLGDDARKYATAIDSWRAKAGLPGDVEWSKEDDCAAAIYRYHPGHFGMSAASTTLDLAALRNALLPLEASTQLALIDSAWSNENLGSPPTVVAPSGLKYWILTRARPGSNLAAGSITLPSWMPWLMLVWFLIPPVGVAGCLIVGTFVAKNQRISLPRRRKLYLRIVMGGSLAVIGIHGLFVVATLPTRVFEPLAQLWFGQTFAQFAIPIVSAFVLVPLAALPFANWQEKRLMGPTPKEISEQEPGGLRTIDRKSVFTGRNRCLIGGAIILIVAGLAGTMMVLNLDRKNPYRQALFMLSMMCAVMPIPVVNFLKRKPLLLVDDRTLERTTNDIRKSVDAMAARLDMPAPPSRVLTQAMYGRFSAVADRKGVGVTVQALETLPREQIDFLVAHQLAELKLGQPRKRKLLIGLLPSFVSLPMSSGILSRSRPGGWTGGMLPFMMLPFLCLIPMLILIRQFAQRQCIAADRLAVQATGDPASAIATIKTIAVNRPRPGMSEVGTKLEPAVAVRIAAIEALA